LTEWELSDLAKNADQNSYAPVAPTTGEMLSDHEAIAVSIASV
jgi:hypothetical protein